MASDVKAMSGELARDPASLVFVELAEALRQRGQLEHAERVVLGGLEHHPELIEAHDLYARILVDGGDYGRAVQVWKRVLDSDARHLGAHKGLGFLNFRAGDLDGALEHLELALASDPADPSVIRALQTVRNAAAEAAAEADADVETAGPEGEDAIFAGLEGAGNGLLLVDDRGRVLGGRIEGGQGIDVSDTVAAFLAGAAQEAERTARMLGLGEWQWLVTEGPDGNVYVTPPTADTLLLIQRDRSVPSGRLAMLAERAGAVARQWLEGQEL
jgi:tetratricopeptide (TPR) repeat protein